MAQGQQQTRGLFTAEAPARAGSAAAVSGPTTRARLAWVELVKGIALVWIFINHAAEQIFGGPYIANPWANWPAFDARLAQLRPLDGYGIWDVPLNILRYTGWFGDQGVQLFLIASGFGLTWGLLVRQTGPLRLGQFYLRRAGRIYPLWWGAHLLFLVAGVFLTGLGLRIADPNLYLSLLGLRVTPGSLYFFSPAWWYFTLLVQLYLVYPIVWAGLRRYGALRLLIVSCAIAFAARAAGLLAFDSYLDAWSRGAIFITRLPEFVFGVSLAAWMHQAPEQTDRRLRAPGTLALALVSYALGTALALTLAGMAVAPFLLGVGIFVLLYAVLGGSGRAGRGQGVLGWIGGHSYSLYLVHHPLILLLVPVGLESSRRSLVGFALAALLTTAAALALEGGVAGGQALLGRWYRSLGIVRLAGLGAAIGALVAGLLVGGELAVRWAAPQEVPEFGWGERVSLEPHPVFGWRLKPSSETHLRWESYDYRVTANALGFPGPAYPEQKAPHTLRIMVTGDAFTSAEGVDTGQSWPRLLEADLAGRLPGQRVEVLNFGITGYGPNQYEAVVKTFAPVYAPDVIVIGLFVNDYQDVLVSDEEFRESIGFDRPAPGGWRSIARLSHLRRFIGMRLIEPLKELIRGQPNPYGYFLGHFVFLERGHPEFETTGRQLVAQRLEAIRTVAGQVGARVVIAMIPAPAQVCAPEQLAYYPRGVDLADTARFDPELPQRMTREIARSTGLGYYDLRPALQPGDQGCPYQPHNIHWTAGGHRAVAAYLSDALRADGYLEER